MCVDTFHDEESTVGTNEPDVEYTEVVHPRPVDPTMGKHSTNTQTIYVCLLVLSIFANPSLQPTPTPTRF